MSSFRKYDGRWECIAVGIGLTILLVLVGVGIYFGIYFFTFTAPSTDSQTQAPDIHHPVYGSYPSEVKFEQGMTLMPGQVATINACIEIDYEPTFNDLLDAIEWVESKGKVDAIGDPIERPDLVDCSGNIWINEPLGGNTFEIYEKDGKQKVREYLAVGAYQIHKIYVDDVCRILGKNKYTYANRWDRDKSREMVRIYLDYYYNHTRQFALQFGEHKDFWTELVSQSKWETMAKIHNGGPAGWRKDCTKPYWQKVKSRMFRKMKGESE